MTKTPAIALHNVSFRYPGAAHESLSHIDLEVACGECIVLTGASGCGKTTLTRLLNGLAEQFYEGTAEGEVLLFGEPLRDRPIYEIGNQVGSIFQDPKSQFFASITEDEIAFGCENFGLPRDDIIARVNEALVAINGEQLRGQQIYPMSSGEKQKIAIASVNATEPRVYVFDEPSANLDMASVEALRVLMARLKASGHTLIVAEHRLYYLTELADRFIYMQDGRISETWTPTAFLAMSEEKRRAKGIRAADLSRVATEALPVPAALPSLEVEHLRFSYRKREVFSGLSFTAYSGEIVAVCGHNGVGKTTLAHLLCGIAKERDGVIRFGGNIVPRRVRRKAAYFVMQNTDCQLFADSVMDELRINGGSRFTDEAYDELLALYRLESLKEVHPATLSGGQKQRLTLAVSDLIDTPILILDEPTSGLDFRNMQRISNHLKSLAATGRTLFIITHDYEFVAMTCHRVLHLENGGAVEAFSVAENLDRLYDCLMQHSAV